MYVRNEDEYNILRRAEDLTDVAFDWQTIDDEMTGFVNEDPYVIIDDLCTIIDELQEKIEDMEERHQREIEENYKPISPYEFYGVSEDDFH